MKTELKHFVIYQKVDLHQIEITWVVAFDEQNALIKAGFYRSPNHRAEEV